MAHENVLVGLGCSAVVCRAQHVLYQGSSKKWRVRTTSETEIRQLITIFSTQHPVLDTPAVKFPIVVV